MATRRTRNKIVTNIVARLEAEDNASPELKKATEEGRNLAEASRRVIKEFQRMDNHSAAVAKNIKQIRDSSLRAKVAMETMRGTFTGNVTALDKLEDKLTLVKIKLDNMGAAGTLIRKALTGLKFAAIGAAAAIGIAFADAVRKAIETNTGAKAAADKLTDSWTRLQVAAIDATIGIDNGTAAMTRTSRAMEGLAALTEQAAKDTTEWSTAWDVARGPLTLAGLAIDGTITFFEDLGDTALSTAIKVEELTASQRALNQELQKSAKGFTGARGSGGLSMRGQGGLADYSNTYDNRQRIEALRKQREAASRRGGGGGGPTGPRVFNREINDQFLENQFKAAEAEKELGFARQRQANALENLLISATALNEQAPTMRDNILGQVEAVDMLTPAMHDLAKNGIGVVTGAIGNMITSLVAGEGSLAGFGAALAGQLGATVKQAGAAAIGMGAMSLLFSSGGWTTPGGAGALIGIGTGLLATGAILEGLASRAQKTFAGGGGGGGAASAAQDAVNAVVNNTERGRESGPRETTIVVGEREMRGFVVDTTIQAVDLGELSLVPMGTL